MSEVLMHVKQLQNETYSTQTDRTSDLNVDSNSQRKNDREFGAQTNLNCDLYVLKYLMQVVTILRVCR